MHAAMVKFTQKSFILDYRKFWRNRFDWMTAINILLLSAILVVSGICKMPK